MVTLGLLPDLAGLRFARCSVYLEQPYRRWRSIDQQQLFDGVSMEIRTAAPAE